MNEYSNIKIDSRDQVGGEGEKDMNVGLEGDDGAGNGVRDREYRKESDGKVNEIRGEEESTADSAGIEKPRERSRIDVHHHFIPDCYIKAYQQAGNKDPSGWQLPSWDLEATKSLMTEQSIGTAILSLTAPGCTLLHGPAAAQLAREVNESAASIRDAEPSRFGFFAALPPILDDMDAAVREAIHALDILHADGVTLYTRYGAGNTYLGDAAFVPLWTALNARHAVIFIHPTHLPTSELINPALPQPLIDYPHETTRTAVDLLMHRRMHTHLPNCPIILSHAGGTLPYLATRVAHLLPDCGLGAQPAAEFLADARTFYYDLALSSNEFTLALLLRFVGPERVLFGTDFPYAPLKTVRMFGEALDRFGGVEEGGLEEGGLVGGGLVEGGWKRKVERDNALGLFPRLRGEGDR